MRGKVSALRVVCLCVRVWVRKGGEGELLNKKGGGGGGGAHTPTTPPTNLVAREG
jgi:hypothetical protein